MSESWEVNISWGIDPDAAGGGDAALRNEITRIASEKGGEATGSADAFGRRVVTFAFGSRPEAFAFQEALGRSERVVGVTVEIVDPTVKVGKASELDLDIVSEESGEKPTVGNVADDSGRYRAIPARGGFDVALGDLEGEAAGERDPNELELFEEEITLPAGSKPVKVFAVFGVLNGETGDALDERIGDLMAKGCRVLVLNMRSVTDMDSAGAAHLVACHELLAAQKGRLVLALVPLAVRSVIDRLRLGKTLLTFETREEAIASAAG